MCVCVGFAVLFVLFIRKHGGRINKKFSIFETEIFKSIELRAYAVDTFPAFADCTEKRLLFTYDNWGNSRMQIRKPNQRTTDNDSGLQTDPRYNIQCVD